MEINDKYQDNFSVKYKEVIEKLYELFKNDINENESIRIIKTLKGIPCLTIFEAFNLIYREVQIIKTILKSETNNKENMIIFKNENKDEFESIEFNNVIEKYKIKSDDNNIEESWKPINEFEERRIIKINTKNNIFNYLPIKAENINIEKNKEELYSKNENEFLYHPLFYKTIMCHYCKIENNHNTILCPYSHDIQKDFRIIYDYKNENICKFLNFLYNNELFTFTNYTNYIPIDPSIFDINTFKVFKCPFDDKCKEDKHLCPFYHSPTKKRRPPLLFRYNIDDKCFDKNKKIFKVDKCPFGIFCNGIHSQNEYSYHSQNFRKQLDCIRKKINGHCIFLKTCYGKHPDEEYELYEKELKEDKTEKIKNEDETIIKLNDKKATIINLSEYFKCRYCKNLPKKGKIKFLSKCNHFLCKKCFEEIYNEGDKICPFCETKISKKNVVNLYFTNFTKKEK